MKKRIPIILIILVVAVLFYLSSYPFGCGNREEIIIIGLDGGTWNVIRLLVETGDLPNIKKLIDTGTYGGLISLESSTPSVVWTSIAVGKENISAKTKTVWEILSENKKTVGTAYWPSGSGGNLFVIPNELDAGKETYPRDLYDSGARLLLGNPFLEFFWKLYYFKILIPANKIDKDLLYDFYLLNCKSREFFYLRDKFKPDVSAVVFDGLDRLQHYFWMYMEPQRFQVISGDETNKYGKVIEEYYKQFDGFVGRLRECNEDAVIFIISGYGFDATIPPKIIDGILVNNILERANLLSFDYMGEIDFSGTKAHSSGGELENEITVYVDAKDEEEYETIRNRVVDLFSDVYIQETPAFVISETKEGIVLKRNVPMELAGDIVISGKSYPIEEFVLRRIISGRRTNEGIFIISGKDIEKGVIYNATIYDIAPTILHLSEMSVSEGMSGRILSGMTIR